MNALNNLWTQKTIHSKCKVRCIYKFPDKIRNNFIINFNISLSLQMKRQSRLQCFIDQNLHGSWLKLFQISVALTAKCLFNLFTSMIMSYIVCYFLLPVLGWRIRKHYFLTKYTAATQKNDRQILAWVFWFNLLTHSCCMTLSLLVLLSTFPWRLQT